MKNLIKKLFGNKTFHIFIGIVIVILLIFSGTIVILNQSSHKKEVSQEIAAFKEYKKEQIDKDIKQIKEEVLVQEKNQYSDFNYYVETSDSMVKSIEGGYCYEDTNTKSLIKMECTKYGNNSVECLRVSKCRKEKYTAKTMYMLIKAHSMLEDNVTLINKALDIYDKYSNWDIYSIVLAAKDSINNRMLKEAALSVWGKDAIEKTEKIESNFNVIWFWKKECKKAKPDCRGADVIGYKRDVLVFNNSGSLFYYLIDR